LTNKKIIAILFVVGWTAYMAYAVLNQTGLYALAISLQDNLFGAYDPIWTVILMWLVPVTVAAYHISPAAFHPAAAQAGDIGNPDAEHPTPEAAELARMGTVIRVTGWSILVGALATAACVGVGMKMPVGHEDPVVIDIATLTDSEPPRGRVEIQGRVLFDAMTWIEEEGDSSTTITAYVPIVAAGKDLGGGSNGGPFRFFQKVQTYGSEPTEAFFDRIGYLKPEVLPVLLRDVYEENGMELAKRTYVLDGSALNWRETMFVSGGVIGMISVMVFAVWIGLLIRRRRLRKAVTSDQLVS